MAVKYKHPRGTRSALNSLAGSSGLETGQIYVITDEARIAVALSASTYATYAKENAEFAAIEYVIDGGGSAITTGLKGFLEVPFACTIMQWTLMADVSGSIVVDIWKGTYANYPPTSGDVITASAKPTISSAVKGQSATLTGWTTSISENDILAFNVNSVSTVTRVTLSLKVRKT